MLLECVSRHVTSAAVRRGLLVKAAAGRWQASGMLQAGGCRARSWPAQPYRRAATIQAEAESFGRPCIRAASHPVVHLLCSSATWYWPGNLQSSEHQLVFGRGSKVQSALYRNLACLMGLALLHALVAIAKRIGLLACVASYNWLAVQKPRVFFVQGVHENVCNKPRFSSRSHNGGIHDSWSLAPAA